MSDEHGDAARRDAAGASDYSGSSEALNASLKWRVSYMLRRAVALWQMKQAKFALGSLPAPVFVGATGGSGTRAVAQVLQEAGVNLGSRHNFALDAMDFVPFVVRTGRAYLTSGVSTPGMDTDLDVAVFRFRRGMRAKEQWGAKGPRFIYFLPYLAQRLPGMKFIHVVRDGRDMAFAPNQSQLVDYSSFLVDASLHSAPQPVQSIALWNRVNLDAKRFGEEKLRESYLLVRFEDLCGNPAAEVERIFTFIGSTLPRHTAIVCIREQKTAGRWKSAAPELLQQMSAVADEGLREFGYR